MKVEIKGFLYQVRWGYADRPEYGFGEHKMDDMSDAHHQYVTICEHTIHAEIPDDFDPRPQVVANLREQKQKVLADAHVRAEAIEEQIQQVLCLEYKEPA